MANICDKTLDDKSRRIQHIETLMAFDLFCNYKFRCLNLDSTHADINLFSESMAVFLRLDIDPSHVIGLYGSLLPPDFQVCFLKLLLTASNQTLFHVIGEVELS